MSPKHSPEVEFELSDEELSEEELKHISGGFLGGKIAIIAVLIG